MHIVRGRVVLMLLINVCILNMPLNYCTKYLHLKEVSESISQLRLSHSKILEKMLKIQHLSKIFTAVVLKILSYLRSLVSDIAVFVLKRDVKLELTHPPKISDVRRVSNL